MHECRNCKGLSAGSSFGLFEILVYSLFVGVGIGVILSLQGSSLSFDYSR